MSWLRLHRWGCIRSIRTPAFNLPQCSRRLLSTSCHRSWFWQWNRWHDIFATKDSIMILTLVYCVFTRSTLLDFLISVRTRTQTCYEISFSPQVFIVSGECLFKLKTTMYAVDLWRKEKAWNDLWDVSSRKIQTVERESFPSTLSGYSLHSHPGQSSLSEIKSSQF